MTLKLKMLKRITIRSYEMGLYFRDGEFKGLLGEGRHWFFDPFGKIAVEVVSQCDSVVGPRKARRDRKSGALKDRAVVLDLKDDQRALVWIEGRFSHILPPGLHAYWTGRRDVKVELVDARSVRFVHDELPVTVALAVCRPAVGHLPHRARPRWRIIL